LVGALEVALFDLVFLHHIEVVEVVAVLLGSTITQ
jgi:hypothetical protein